jgi:hypothetical protein
MSLYTVWKFPFEVADQVVLRMPEGAEVLDVQAQDGVPTLWAVVDVDAPLVERRFELRGTGHPLGDIGPYVGTFQLLGGGFVGHLFEGPR